MAAPHQTGTQTLQPLQDVTTDISGRSTATPKTGAKTTEILDHLNPMGRSTCASQGAVHRSHLKMLRDRRRRPPRTAPDARPGPPRTMLSASAPATGQGSNKANVLGDRQVVDETGMNEPMEEAPAPRPQEPVLQQEEQESRERYQDALNQRSGTSAEGTDRLDMAAAALDAALRRIGDDPTVGEVLAVAGVQGLIAVAGELRSIREAGINQGDTL